MPRLGFAKYRPRIAPQSFGRWMTRVALLALLAIAGSLLVGFVRMTWTLHQIKQEQIQEQAQLIEARNIVAQRKGEAEYRESGVYVEQAAREQLGYARDGDTVILPELVAPAVPTPEPAAPPIAVLDAPLIADAPSPNYARWWSALFPRPDAQP